LETEEESKAPRPLLAVMGVVLIVLLVGIGASLAVPLQPPLGSTPPAPVAGVSNVIMPNDAASVGFSPKNITVFVGVNNTIVWTNEDSATHTVTWSSVPPGATVYNSTALTTGDTFRITLNSTGVYDYYCSFHPATMRGSVTVKGGPTVYILPGTATRALNYSPDNITVVIGINNTVTFVNDDTVVHTVTSDDGTSFSSGDIHAGASWTYTFATVGTFGFHCIYHPSFMKGTITVVAGSG